MNKRHILTLLAAGIFSVLSLHGQDDGDLKTAFMKELHGKNAEITSITCRFRQTRSMSILAKDVVRKGTFHYLKPDRILLNFENGDFIKINETDFQIRNSDNTYRQDVSASPMIKGIRRIMTACMDGNLEQLSKGLEMTVEASDTRYTVRLTDKKNRKAAKISCIILIFEKTDLSLSMLELKENSGDFTRYDFTDKRFNRETAPGLYKID